MMSKNDWTKSIGKALAKVSALRSFTESVSVRPETASHGITSIVTAYGEVKLYDSRFRTGYEVRRNNPYTNNLGRHAR